MDDLYKQLKLRGKERGIANDNDLEIRWMENLNVLKTKDFYDYTLVNDIVSSTAKE